MNKEFDNLWENYDIVNNYDKEIDNRVEHSLNSKNINETDYNNWVDIYDKAFNKSQYTKVTRNNDNLKIDDVNQLMNILQFLIKQLKNPETLEEYNSLKKLKNNLFIMNKLVNDLLLNNCQHLVNNINIKTKNELNNNKK